MDPLFLCTSFIPSASIYTQTTNCQSSPFNSQRCPVIFSIYLQHHHHHHHHQDPCADSRAVRRRHCVGGGAPVNFSRRRRRAARPKKTGGAGGGGGGGGGGRKKFFSKIQEKFQNFLRNFLSYQSFEVCR